MSRRRRPTPTNALNDDCLAAVLSWLPWLPDRASAAAVGRAWRRADSLVPRTALVAPERATSARLAALVARAPQLTALDLRAQRTPVKPGAQLQALLALPPSTTSVELKSMGARQLAAVATRCPALQRLAVDEAAQLGSVPPGSFSALRELSLQTPVASAALEALFRTAGGSLRGLHLWRCGADTLAVFAARHVPVLHELTLQGAHCLAQVAPWAPTLRWLNLSWPGPGVRPRARPRRVAPMPQLLTAVLDYVTMADGELAALVAGSPLLRQLSLHKARPADWGELLAAPLAALRQLDVRDTTVAEAHVQALQLTSAGLVGLSLDSCRSVARATRAAWRGRGAEIS